MVSIAWLVVMVYSSWELLRLGVVEMVVGIVVEDSHSKIVVVDKFDVVAVGIVGVVVVEEVVVGMAVVVVVVVGGKCKNFAVVVVMVEVACIVVVVVLVAVAVEGGK